MARSMTAYSQAASSEVVGLSWSVEFHSVNKKALDIHMHLPRELLFLDLELRKMISEVVFRGHVTAKISYQKGKKKEGFEALLKQLKGHWMKIATELGYSKEEITLSFLLKQSDQMPLEEFGPKVQTELKRTVQEALATFIVMKEDEGRALQEDILKRLKLLNQNLQEIEKASKNSAKTYREKLQKRLEDLLQNADSDERILREVALFAEKVDITEEIIRLRAHLAQGQKIFKSKEKSIGRTLEFLLQEILREFNTIGSKSPELGVTQLVLASKAELEKIREQVQNIE